MGKSFRKKKRIKIMKQTNLQETVRTVIQK